MVPLKLSRDEMRRSIGETRIAVNRHCSPSSRFGGAELPVPEKPLELQGAAQLHRSAEGTGAALKALPIRRVAKEAVR